MREEILLARRAAHLPVCQIMAKETGDRLIYADLILV